MQFLLFRSSSEQVQLPVPFKIWNTRLLQEFVWHRCVAAGGKVLGAGLFLLSVLTKQRCHLEQNLRPQTYGIRLCILTRSLGDSDAHESWNTVALEVACRLSHLFLIFFFSHKEKTKTWQCQACHVFFLWRAIGCYNFIGECYHTQKHHV